MLRDGRDVACSIRDRTGSLEKGIRRWVSDNTLGRPYWDHPRVRVVKYEDLVESFQSTIRGVLEFIGSEYQDLLQGSQDVLFENDARPDSPAGGKSTSRFSMDAGAGRAFREPSSPWCRTSAEIS